MDGTNDPTAVVAALEARATRMETPCGDGTMLWRVWGSGPPVALLHGASGSWLHWIRNIGPLARHFRVFAADLPGYGDSAEAPPPADEVVLAEVVAAGLRRLLPMPQRFDLVAFSFGGIVAGHVAARLPGRLRHLVLIGPNGLGASIPPARPLLRVPAGADAATEAEVHRHNLAAVMIHDPARVDDLAVLVHRHSLARARTRSGTIPLSDSLLRILPEAAATISGIWGERDALAAPYVMERARILGQIQPDLDFRVIPGAGHWAPYEAADAVNAAIADILSRG